MPATSPSPSPSAAVPDDVVTALRASGCVFAEDEAHILVSAAAGPAELADLLRRRVHGEPLEHVVGWAEFRGLRIAVDPGVFVPRRRTEHLVDQAVEPAPPRPLVVDLCCGSGALGAAVATDLDGCELHAADIDPAAVRCARRNLAPFGGRVHLGDLFGALPAALRGRIDLLLANVPYVPTGALGLLPAEARDHEARVALDGGPDGLDVVRRVTAGARRWLAPGGRLLFETGAGQAADALACAARAGLTARLAVSEEYEATVVVATCPAPDADVTARHEHR